jgi:hypothetical protein
MLAIAAWPSLLFQKLAWLALRSIIVGLPIGVRGLARYFARAVPNRANGGIPRFFAWGADRALVSIAKHWGISL